MLDPGQPLEYETGLLLTGTEMRTFGTSNESRLVKLPTQNYTASPLFVVRYICKALRFHGG